MHEHLVGAEALVLFVHVVESVFVGVCTGVCVCLCVCRGRSMRVCVGTCVLVCVWCVWREGGRSMCVCVGATRELLLVVM